MSWNEFDPQEENKFEQREQSSAHQYDERYNNSSYTNPVQYSTGAPGKEKREKMNHNNGYGSGSQHRGRRALGYVAGILAASIISGASGGIIVYNIITPTLQEMDRQIASIESEVDRAAIVTTNTGNSQGSNTGTTGSETSGDSALMSVEEIASMASPAVVAIGTQTMQETAMGYRTVMAAGSGVIVSSDGYIVTNNHVVEGSTETTVTLASGESYDAQIIGTDETTDLAVIKIEPTINLPFLTFGDSDELQIGETVVAIGNPLGEFEGTVTRGVVSGKNRTITIDNTTMLNLIQTDAAINSGNSGGALLNLRGEVIGINSAKTAAVGVEGIAFAIPSETVVPTIEELIESGEVTRPMLGITGSPVPQNNYGLPTGVMVRDVQSGSNADRAGIQISDIITEVNGVSINSIGDINAYKAQIAVGEAMVLGIYRDGEELTIEVVLEAD